MKVPDNVLCFSRIQGNNHERRDWIPNQHPIDLMKFIVALSCSGNEEIVEWKYTASGKRFRNQLYERGDGPIPRPIKIQESIHELVYKCSLRSLC